MTTKPPDRQNLALQRRRRFDGKQLLGLLLLTIGFVIGAYGYVLVHGTNFELKQFAADFYANLSSGFLAIAITVLLIDHLNELRAQADLRHQLTREMGSSDKAVAARAARELRGRGWLVSGSLVGQDFSAANLSTVDLSSGNFSSALFVAADLDRISAVGAKFLDAKMSGTNLKGANLENSDFSRADLRLADFTDANLVGASFVDADLSGAIFSGSNITDKQLQAAASVRSVVLSTLDNLSSTQSRDLDETDSKQLE